MIPFERDQAREITIRYGSRYSENDESVSDDSHISDATFAYSLSPAATWKGPIGKGKIEINILHPEPEDVSIEKPKERFQKISDTHYQWNFENLKPSLADDIRIIAHSKYDSYATGYSEEDLARTCLLCPARSSIFSRSHRLRCDCQLNSATARQTPITTSKTSRAIPEEGSPWAEGVEGDGIGESITLNVKRPLPLYGILIRPGYWEYESEGAWLKNNRVGALEITLNDEQIFTETIPDETFHEPYLIRVRDYTKPINKIKLVIKECIAEHNFATLASRWLNCARRFQKTEVHPAR